MTDYGLRRSESFCQLVETGIVIAFREAATLLRHEKWNVRIGRMRQVQKVLQEDLLRRGDQQVHSPHDAVDSLLGIVDDHGELIGKQAIGSANDEVTAIALKVLREMTLHQIV